MPPKPGRELSQIGCYLRQDQAEERGLVVLALGLSYWVIEDDGLFCLYVDVHDAGAATAELEKFETERDAEREDQRQLRRDASSDLARSKPRTFSLYVFVWTLCLYFGLQWAEGPHWTVLGAADSTAILHGEGWRTVTALTLHADLGHLFANLATGLLFAWALLPLLGTGWTWLGMLLGGAVGNLLNAALHSGRPHVSLGASTGVFAGIGLLVAWQIVAVIQRYRGHPNRPMNLREIAFHTAAGLALLAYLGVGSSTDNVDIMAHALGLLSGGLIGFALAGNRLPERTSPGLQQALALTALLLPALAWLLALNR